MKSRQVFRTTGNFFSKSLMWLRNNFFGIFLAWITVLFIPFILRYFLSQSFSGQLYSNIEDVPDVRVALVLGAGLDGKDAPGGFLKDRIQSAVNLYKAGKVKKIIMSGDNRTLDYDEPTAMIKLAKDLGVPESDLQPDYAGRRTFDSCFRARKIFELNEVVVVTQGFHMDRAVYICSSLGIKTIGFLSDQNNYGSESFYYVRDTYALMLAIWDVNIVRPQVVLGDKIEI